MNPHTRKQLRQAAKYAGVTLCFVGAGMLIACLMRSHPVFALGICVCWISYAWWKLGGTLS
jgi:hypothetical protein